MSDPKPRWWWLVPLVVWSFVVLVLGGFIASLNHDSPKAKDMAPDPWRAESLRLVGSLDLADGGKFQAVRVPGWPTASMCLIYSGDHGVSMRCDADFPTNHDDVPPEFDTSR